MSSVATTYATYPTTSAWGSGARIESLGVYLPPKIVTTAESRSARTL